jgi:hypothetical protein
LSGAILFSQGPALPAFKASGFLSQSPRIVYILKHLASTSCGISIFVADPLLLPRTPEMGSNVSGDSPIDELCKDTVGLSNMNTNI